MTDVLKRLDQFGFIWTLTLCGNGTIQLSRLTALKIQIKSNMTGLNYFKDCVRVLANICGPLL
jgi:hypothetical protein